MQKIMLASLFSIFTVVVFAQTPVAKKEVSDPQAKEVLEKMRKKYEAFQTLEAEFSLEIEVPQQPKQTQKGKLVQQGEKYRLNLNDRTLVSDGKAVWLYIAKNKEVQINDVEEDAAEGGISSPQDLLKAYAWNDYIYGLTNEFSENGKLVQQIEFKPISKDSDYSKIRLTLDKKTLDIVSIKSFGKDGSRYTLIMNKLTPNKQTPATTFTFAKTECPECRFEDLRM
ncbi:MAG: outer membrane lipoprotein carrier protein LolA [Bacteroidetes bacterium]|nr:outer membrane lipoprotein carrier protein LolA [Bacteroidota bacterium]